MNSLNPFQSISKLPKSSTSYEARLAIYNSFSTPPDTQELIRTDLTNFLQELAELTYFLHQKSGGMLPYTAIDAIIENLIHANCLGVVVTVLPKGNGVRIADQGIGICDKVKALQLGFSTATPEHRNYIKGVGSGLGIASKLVSASGGELIIEDNLGKGTVVSLISSAAVSDDFGTSSSILEGANFSGGENYTNKLDSAAVFENLSRRQLEILAALLKHGALGPSKIAELISTSPSSAYRDLVTLTESGLLVMVNSGKRQIEPSIRPIIEQKLQILGD